MRQTGRDLEFSAFYTESKTGKTGLTVTVDVYNPSGTKVVTGASASAIGGGLYKYTLAGASNTESGIWKALFHTETGTVDQQDIPACWEVDNTVYGNGSTEYTFIIQDEVGLIAHAAVWITSTGSPTASPVAGTLYTDSDGECKMWLDPTATVYIWVDSPTANFTNPTTWVVGTGGTTKTITGTHVTAGYGPTFAELLGMLRIRLNDVGEGNYTDTELKRCINDAYRDTQAITKCHKIVQSFAFSTGVSVYSVYPIFEPFAVEISGANINRTSVEDMSVVKPWTGDASGAPVKWMQITGSRIQLYPTPDSNGTMSVTGYAIAPDMSADGDFPYAIPAGFAAASILERAEQLARGLRPTHANNVNIASGRGQMWQGWCDAISEHVKGGR